MNYRHILLAIMAISTSALLQARQDGHLLFYLSADKGATADFAEGEPFPNIIGNVFQIGDGAKGAALHCACRQLLSYKAQGNIYARRGTLSFFWRSAEAFTETEFPIFRVSYADHSSWDMVWLRIDYNGHGFDAFVTDKDLARIRVSISVDPLPKPDEWTHFALCWDEVVGIRFYVNGKEAARKDRASILDTGLDQFGPHSRIISPYQVQSAYTMQRGGDIDELHIYDKMLSDKEIAVLAQGCEPEVPDGSEGSAMSEWQHLYGFDKATPPYLEDEVTTVRKVGILESYDEKRWYWKACDGIPETTWPGVYNRSRIEGRNDYFQLPDWDCYSTSGQRLRLAMPTEAWNYLEIEGGGEGAEVSATGVRKGAVTAGTIGAGTVKAFLKQEDPVIADTIIFANDRQEAPVHEFNAYCIHAGDAPQGICRLSYRLGSFENMGNPELKEVEDYVKGRFGPDERGMMLGIPAALGGGGNPLDHRLSAQHAETGSSGQHIVHIVIPSDMRDIDMAEPQTLEGAKTDFGEFGVTWGSAVRSYSWVKMQGGLDGIRIEIPAMKGSDDLFPMNIRIKDPIWKLRNMIDFSFSVRPGESRILWIDLRDRILPDDKPLYLTMAGGEDIDASVLGGMRIDLIFKDRDAASAEHIADRFAQVRDCYAMIVEESTSTRRLAKYRQFEADINDLLKVAPDHELGRKYWHLFNREQPAPPYIEPSVPEGIPEWAFLQLEVLKKYREVFEWYIDRRQMDYGEFGGGISDDTDLTNHFPGLYSLGCIPDKIAKSMDRFMGAIDAEETLTDGMSTIQSDGLHTYEEGVNAVCQLNIIGQGDPQAAERLMESALAVRDRLLGVNAAGHTHFRSDYFSATKIADEGVWAWSSNREYYHTAPALILGEYYGNQGARDYIIKFADSILAHAITGADGKMQLPAEVNFLTDETRSWGRNYAMPMMWYAWLWTGDKRYLRPVADSGWLPSEYTKESLAKTLRQELREIDAREYIMTEGSIWIDRIGFNCNTIQESRMGGIALNRSEHLAPANLVSWSFEGKDDAQRLAILFSKSSRDAFEMDFFNMDDKPMQARMRGQMVKGGRWKLTLPDGRTQTVTFGRGRDLTLEIPARRDYHIMMDLIGKELDFSKKPDAGISSDDLRLTETGLEVTVHNLGNVSLKSVEVVLRDAEGRTMAKAKTPAIQAPTDMRAKMARVILKVPQDCKLEACTVILNPGKEKDEIFANNNSTSFRPRA